MSIDILRKIIREHLEELGPQMAAKAFTPRMDTRTRNIKQDAINGLFRNFIGKNIPFFVKTSSDYNPVQYNLIGATFNENNKTLSLHFYNDNGIEDEAPYADNKKHLYFHYSIDKDNYTNESANYHLNAYAVNFLIKAANVIRQMYFTIHQVMKSTNGYNKYDMVPDEQATVEAKNSKLTKAHFQMFSHDSKNLLNRTIN